MDFTHISQTRPDLTDAAAQWATDCLWANVETDDLAAMSAELILRSVNRHYHGGLAQLATDSRLAPLS